MSTIDEILASGRYTDRRGRKWVRRLFLRPNIRWANIIRDSDGIGWPGEKISEDRMRLLIERDEHKDVCPRLSACSGHPVPSVLAPFEWGSRDFEVYAAWENATGTFEKSLPEAMDAARALAVGE